MVTFLGGHSKRGYTFSEEFKEKCRNRKYSLETRKKMSNSAKGRKVSPDTILKLQKSLLGNSRRSKEVLLYIDGKLVNEFSSIKEASLHSDLSQLSRLCSGKRKTTTNQVWKFK